MVAANGKIEGGKRTIAREENGLWVAADGDRGERTFIEHGEMRDRLIRRDAGMRKDGFEDISYGAKSAPATARIWSDIGVLIGSVRVAIGGSLCRHAACDASMPGVPRAFPASA